MTAYFRPLTIAAAFLLLCALSAHAQTPISWGTLGREFRARGAAPVTLICPPGGVIGPLWGSGTYTDDSSVCTAAVHVGAITAATGGRIILRMKPGQSTYPSIRRNGVMSDPWGPWDTSFTVERAPAEQPDEPQPIEVLHRAPPPAPAPSGPEVIPWDRTALKLAPNGRRFTFMCRATGTPAPVHGVDVYSWDSSICTAAVHAGAITVAKGGIVTIEIRPGAPAYTGSARNGITSQEAQRTTLGFIIIPPP